MSLSNSILSPAVPALSNPVSHLSKAVGSPERDTVSQLPDS